MPSNAQKDVLVLIDASALIYRAYYALPPLTTKDGILVNAVYGFTSALFNAIKNLHPEYVAVAFDSKGPTFRHKEYKAYKATRPKPPENLIAQFPLAREICHVLSIPYFETPGFEADDLIGTISKLKIANCPLDADRRIAEKLKIVIVTGDMDTLQLVDENTQVYSMARGIQQAEIYDADRIKNRYGFGPDQMVDYKALRGDPSDNIPGVPGVGEKTATELIRHFGSIERLYEYIENPRQSAPKDKIRISPRFLALLEKHKNQALLSKKLATIVKDIPIKFHLADCRVHDYDREQAIKLFRKLEFNSLIKRLPHSAQNEKQERLF